MTAANPIALEATPLAPPSDTRGLDRMQSIDLGLLGITNAVGARMVDLGCGDGRHELETARLRLTTLACDIDRPSLIAGRDHVALRTPEEHHKARLHWLQGTAFQLPVRDGTFDAAVCSETLEHIHDDVAVLRELRRATREGGRLAISVPAYLPEFILWQLAWAITHTPGGHIRIYEKPDLLSKLRATGWRPYAVRYRHAFESVHWILGALFGGGTPPPWPARAWSQAVERLNSGPLDRAERLFAKSFGKSLVIYAETAPVTAPESAPETV